MQHIGRFMLCSALASAVGCAVTEPDDRDTARVRAAAVDGEAVSISELASDLGISEVAVVKALPESMRRRWDGPPESAWMGMKTWERVHFEVDVPPAANGYAPVRIAYTGAPVEARVVPPDAYVYLSSRMPVDIALNWEDIAEVWLLRLSGIEQSDAMWFFDSSGVPLIKVSVPRESGPQTHRAYEAMWDRAVE